MTNVDQQIFVLWNFSNLLIPYWQNLCVRLSRILASKLHSHDRLTPCPVIHQWNGTANYRNITTSTQAAFPEQTAVKFTFRSFEIAMDNLKGLCKKVDKTFVECCYAGNNVLNTNGDDASIGCSKQHVPHHGSRWLFNAQTGSMNFNISPLRVAAVAP